MVVPQENPKMIMFSRKIPMVVGETSTILGFTPTSVHHQNVYKIFACIEGHQACTIAGIPNLPDKQPPTGWLELMLAKKKQQQNYNAIPCNLKVSHLKTSCFSRNNQDFLITGSALKFVMSHIPG